MFKKMNSLAFFPLLFFAQNIFCGQLEKYDPISGTLSSIEQVTPLSEKISEKIEEIVTKGTEITQKMIKKTPELPSQIWELVKDHPYLALTGSTATVVLFFGVRKYLKNQKMKQSNRKVKKSIEKIEKSNLVPQIKSNVTEPFDNVNEELDKIFDNVNKELDKTEDYVNQLNQTDWNNTNAKQTTKDLDELNKILKGLLTVPDNKNTNEESDDTSE
jgi:ElaB/YqjD/DUF883 family membrane-anchored ribosome-binding protein